tara:strand:+ start:347 stop:457 length:111 start_codon:yes stop_codon:yes gene_type:complete
MISDLSSNRKAKEGNEYINGLADQWKLILKELIKED